MSGSLNVLIDTLMTRHGAFFLGTMPSGRIQISVQTDETRWSADPDEDGPQAVFVFFNAPTSAEVFEKAMRWSDVLQSEAYKSLCRIDSEVWKHARPPQPPHIGGWHDGDTWMGDTWMGMDDFGDQ